MTVIIKRTDTKAQIDRKLARAASVKSRRSKKGFDAMKYLGKLKNLYGDALAYQKRLRNEWE
ncbi:MAG: hypothetical protein ABI855_15400 [Bacteroidota bacterium]